MAVTVATVFAIEEGGATPVTTYYGWDSQNAWRSCQGPTPSPTQANSPVDFSYNALGRMSAYANADTNTSATYTYDASGQRTKKQVTVAGTMTTTTFAYDGLTLLKLSATQGGDSWRIDYLYDEEGALWGGVYRSPAGSTSPVYFSLITSDRGDVAELCDGDGNTFAAYRYDAWGSPQGAGSYATGVWTQSTSLITSTLAGQIASRQVLRYAAYAWDAESSLYYCSARYYDPATRQWTTGDPAKADGEESAYQYCGGKPVSQSDPSGLLPISRFKGRFQFRLLYSEIEGESYLNPDTKTYYVRNHYYGRLDAIETRYFTDGSKQVKRYKFPALAGDNNLAIRFIKNEGGPLPGKGAIGCEDGRYYPGWVDGEWEGFHPMTGPSDGVKWASFAPGGWKLDPWVLDDEQARGEFWIHGGKNIVGEGDHLYPLVSGGCIKLRPGDITKLKGIWGRWGNKKNQNTCYVQVMY